MLPLLNFTAIDFETANQYPTSACSIGIVKVENGKIVEEVSHLIKPQPNFFISSFIDIHHITKAMVSDAPLFGELWPEISKLIEDSEALVAHNAPFDMRVLKACIEMEMIRAYIPQNFCTVRLSRKYLKFLINHKLNTVCDYFNIELDHHEALSDARGCAKIVLGLNEMFENGELEE
ncbi:MAG: 3'-5' exonuclease [Bacteroidales bacterium]|nr:3'-5' exonuclease [Bacteroidales bacterium]